MNRLKLAAIAAMAGFLCSELAQAQVVLEVLGTYRTGVFGQGAAEISAYDPQTRRVFVVNGGAKTVDILSIQNPAIPVKVGEIRIPADWGDSANSVAVRDGVVAIAVQAAVTQNPGSVVFTDTNGRVLGAVRVGALPDMLTFTPDGRMVLTANEGEPNADYTNDPEGSVSIIDVSAGVRDIAQDKVTTVGFSAFTRANIDPAIRIYGPRASVAQDLEPEYITVSADSTTAYVTLQEANAIGVLDLVSKQFTRLIPLGLKDHSVAGNALDASDRDTRINIANWPVFGMYQPDAIAAFTTPSGMTMLAMANEGDSRDYRAYGEEVRVSAARLDPTVFPNASTLQSAANLGRLTVSRATADTDGDGDLDRLEVLGGRSFTIRDTTGRIVYDSGDQMERLIARYYTANFNASNDNNNFDDRSDNKGPEPEGLAVGTINGRVYAFVGLERVSGIMAYDVTNPAQTAFSSYINPRSFGSAANTEAAGDLGPEGVEFVPASASPNSRPMLIVANEVSGSTTFYQINAVQDVTSRVSVQTSLNFTGNFVFTATITNSGSSVISGPIFGVLTGVPQGVVIRNQQGIAANGPYVKFPVEQLAPGASASVLFEVALQPGQPGPSLGVQILAAQ